MKKTTGQFRMKAAIFAAIPALFCVSQSSWAEDLVPGGRSANVSPEGLDGKQDDEAFDEHGALVKRLGTAWRDLNSPLLTDAALQFADTERVLLRSHKLISAAQVFELATRLAADTGDKASLGRLAKALERSGDKERLQQVNLALKTAGAARAGDPVLTTGTAEALAAIQSVQSEIQAARVAGSKPQLDGLEKSLANAPISDKQKAALKKVIGEARESLGDDKTMVAAVEQLDRLSGVIRPIGEVNEPEGGTFHMPDFKDEMPIDEQVSLFTNSFELLKHSGDRPPVGLELPANGLSKLSKPSRNSGWTDQAPFGSSADYAYSAYGVGSIYQYTNAAGPNSTRNCGQAAVATMLTYHKKYPATPGDKLQLILEKPPFNPDVPFGGGTSPTRVMSCANNYGLNTWTLWGEADMKKWISYKYPVIVVVDVGKAGWGQTGLHYTVIYAYNSNYFWCTNWKGSAKVARSTILNSMVSGAFILTQPK